MPLSGGKYVAPHWVNGGPPALDAGELQAMCDSIVKNQGDAANLQKTLQTLTNTVNGKARMQLVSYVGTGTYGQYNPCSITADFPIELAMFVGTFYGTYFQPVGQSQESLGRKYTAVSQFLSYSYQANAGFCLFDGYKSYGKLSSGGRGISWYHTGNSDKQLNTAGTSFVFALFG